MIESPIEIFVVDRAESDGWFCRKVKWVGRVSAPDRLFAKDGRLVWMEFKRPGADPRASQAAEIKRMRDAGMEVHVVDSIVDGCRILGLELADA